MKKVIKIGLGISFVLYIFAQGVILFLGGSRGYIFSDLTLIEYVKRSSNIVPFQTISTYITAIFDGSMNRDIPIKNLLGNLILFLPFGVYLPIFIRKANRVSVFFIIMVLMLVLVEFMQLVTRRGSFDIDDFLLNMLGALLGFSIWKSKFVEKYKVRTKYFSSGV